MSSLLEARSLCVPAADPSGRAPLAGPIDLAINPGQALTVHGPSGAGKSTLLRALVQLEPRALGTVLFRGASVASAEIPAFRQQVQLVPQTPARFGGTLLDNLKSPFLFAGARGKPFEMIEAERICQQLGLGRGLLDQEASLLSGGEAQRMALARALLLEPLLLLLDEPTASLDERAREAAEEAIAAWRHTDGQRALVLVTHDRGQRDRLTTTKLVLGPGGRPCDADPAP